MNHDNTILRKQIDISSKQKTTATRTFDDEENKKIETETTNSLYEETITNKTVTLLSNFISNHMNNDTNDNQDNLIEFDSFEIGPLKNASKIRQLKDDKKYISSNYVEKYKIISLKLLKVKSSMMNILWMFCH